jgi:hypothetical protein
MQLFRVVMVSALVGLLSCAAPVAAHAQDKAEELLAAARGALGGEKLAAVKGLSVTGEFRRLMGERELNGEVTVDLAAPDQIRRVEEMGIPGGPAFIRTTGLSAGEYWEDTTSRGGGGGFMRFMGQGGQGGPGGPGGQVTEEDRERFRQMAQRRLEGEMRRLMLGFLLRTDAPVTYAGTAQAEDGTAEVLEILPPQGRPMRLFLDQRTHLPLMLTYEASVPRMMTRQAGGPPPDPEEIRRRMQEPPQQATFEMRFAEYKSVNGVMLPHLVTQSTQGRPTEEWTISRIRVNPSFKPDTFTKKK